MNKIRAYLIDDHRALREAVAAMLNAQADIVVVGQSGDAATGIADIETLCPDLVLLDLKMPGQSGMSAIGQIFAASASSKVMVFTMYDNPGYVWATMNAGATGYVMKSASSEELLRAVRAVASGSGFLQAEVTMPLLKRLAREAKIADESSVLSGREMDILESLAAGKSNKMIARDLSLSEDTVKSHLRRVYEKIGAADRAHAVAIALRMQIIE
ncbi:response regulator transcription factor [Sinimarinibacterium sp. CAU 1509]|uniref:response regulator n=1 Tax=Sinimarinibacterium sp. CAU 1509 TaxID=2562283 RepID=UPI0010ABFD7A|nr:response regulator transcription factor [Sinimarinibacterium sp. CAU 1509]TJY59536.1 response regulator transcription factor [Sinimarinibacterium sp. CAU 1509]